MPMDTCRTGTCGQFRRGHVPLPGERQPVDLSLRHVLDGADLAAVLGVSRNRAHALVSSARGQLEKALGVLLVARTGRRACPVLDGLLADGDGRLTAHTRKEISRHKIGRASARE